MFLLLYSDTDPDFSVIKWPLLTFPVTQTKAWVFFWVNGRFTWNEIETTDTIRQGNFRSHIHSRNIDAYWEMSRIIEFSYKFIILGNGWIPASFICWSGKIWRYFQKRWASGGGDCSMIQKVGEKTYKIHFKEKEGKKMLLI